MLKLTLVTPDKKILEGATMTKVVVPAFRGELEILPQHADMVTTLETGVLTYTNEGETHKVAISWGYCEIFGNQINVLAETAEMPSEIDIDRAEMAKKNALDNLAKGTFENTEKFRKKFHRAEARIEAKK